MKLRLHLPALCVAVAALCATAPLRGDAREERAEAAFLLAQGRIPTDAERPEWIGAADTPFAELLARQRAGLVGDAAVLHAAAVRAWRDAYGAEPSAGELAAASAGGTYFEQLQRHLARLVGEPELYRHVVDRAYRRVLGREAYAIEQDYWKQRAPLTFVLLVGCIDSWAMRNAPGLMATTGIPSVSVNCRYLAVRRLSPAVAAEVRAAIGFAPEGAPALATARGRNLIAPGAGEIASIGGIHFVAVGGERLAASD